MRLQRHETCVFFLFMVFIASSCSKEELKLDPQDGLIAFEVIDIDDKPVIGQGAPGTEDNQFGFEGGRIVRINDSLHLTTAEMIG